MTLWGEVAPGLSQGRQLSYQQARELMRAIMQGELDEVRLASLLSILAVRGITVDELSGLADEMRAGASPISLPSDVVDIVGTGGDRAGTINISTMASVALAAAGQRVVKHGSRASTSLSGAADILEALGVRLDAPPTVIADVFDRTGIAFLFAEQFHPSIRHAAHVRRKLGFPTAFNIVGPLTNPVAPSASVVGVARTEATDLVAGVFARRSTEAFVMRGANFGLDELTTAEPSHMWIVHGGQVSRRMVDAADILGLKQGCLSALQGGGPEQNAAVARKVFSGSEGAAFDAVALNAALGLMAARTSAAGDPRPDWHDSKQFDAGLAESYEQIRATLLDGQAARLLERWAQASN